MSLKDSKKIVVIYLILASLLAARTCAKSSKATQHITITVPAVRALYLDQNDQIIAVLSNVQSIEKSKLKVFRAGSEIKPTAEILKRYEKLLHEIDWSKIGWIYLEKENKKNRNTENSEKN